ncbi:MAG: alkaline phosphatase family protein [Pirellulales bacterium]
MKKSLFFGIDGLGFGTQGFSVTSTPFMDSLIDGTWQAAYNGAYSDQAFAGGILGTPTEQVTVSGPGWSTMLTGVWTDRHGVTGNGAVSFGGGDFANNPPYLATLKEANPTLSTASYVYWGPIDDYIISSIDNDGDLTNDVNFHQAYGNDVNAVNAAVAGIGDVGGLDPDAVFISVDLVDGAGHSCGSSGLCYKTAVQTADSFVGQALSAIASRPNFANEDWQIVITADHGHRTGGGHGGQSDLERTIPFIVASKNLSQGNLPLSFPQAVSHADASPTILDHFGVAIPDHYYGVSRAVGQLEGDPDINGDGFVQGDGTGTFENDDVVAFISLWLQPNTAENPNPADFNFDGITDLSDWIFLNGFDPAMGQAILSALSVPEPGSLALTLTLIGLLTVRRGRCW